MRNWKEILKLVTAAGYNQADIAHWLSEDAPDDQGISENAVSKWVRLKTPRRKWPDLRQAQVIADRLRMPVEFVMDEEWERIGYKFKDFGEIISMLKRYKPEVCLRRLSDLPPNVEEGKDEKPPLGLIDRDGGESGKRKRG